MGEDADGDGHVLEHVDGEWVFDPGDRNLIDDDGNGYIDDFVGWDFYNDDNNPYDDYLFNSLFPGHGTHVAGIIAASGNNSLGIAGISWGASIMALKVFNGSGLHDQAASAAILEAIQYSIAMQVPISNNSWGVDAGTTHFDSEALSDMISFAEENNQLMVMAAGNTPRFSEPNNDSIPVYPASYPHNNIISVAATDAYDSLASFSHFGQTSVDVCAPGLNIYSTIPGGGYDDRRGTSMAAPHVSGVAALLLSQCNTLTYAEIKDRILNNVDTLPQLNGKCVTGGRINAYKALNTSAGPDQAICWGESTALNASGGGTYQWSHGLGNDATVNVNPDTTTTYAVTITNGGCVDVDSVTVSVTKVIADAGADQTICLGETAILTATGGTDYYWATFQAGPQITVSPTATTTYPVLVINNDCIDIDEVTVFVNNATADAGPDQTICLGENVSLTATGNGTYQWSHGLGTDATAFPSPSATTTYTVTVTNNGCTATDQVTVFVNATIADAGIDQTICVGESAELNASGGTSFLWSNGQTDAQITVSPTATTTYTVTVTNNGCTDADQVTVFVNIPGGANPTYQVVQTQCGLVPMPSPTILATENAENVAINEGTLNNGIWQFTPIGFDFVFDDVSHSLVNIQTNGLLIFGWTEEYTGFSGLSIPDAGEPNNFIAGLYGDWNLQCGGTISYQTVGTAPNRRFVAMWEDVPPYCGGSACNTSCGGSATFQIVLHEGSNEIQTIIETFPSDFLPSSSGSPNATQGMETEDGSTGSPTPGRNNEDFRGIVPSDLDCTLFVPPSCCDVVTNFTASTGNIACANESITFTNNSLNATTYQWDFGDGNTSTATNPVHDYANAGTYTVTLIASNNDCLDSYQQILTIKPEPDFLFAHNASNLYVDFYSNASNVTTYDWTITGLGSISDSPNANHTFAAYGTYEVCLSVGNNDCPLETHCENIEVTFNCGIPPPEIEWEYNFGDGEADAGNTIIQTSDGGFMVVGYSTLLENRDYLAIKLTSQGQLEWQTLLGGSGVETAHSVQQLPDGGYLIAGSSNSDDAFITGNHGKYDAWLVRLSPSGDLWWKRSMGGSESDNAYGAFQVSDGYIIIGNTNSNDQNVSGNHGELDIWVVKLDFSRVMVWQKCLGGSDNDAVRQIQPTFDGGYIITGYTESNDGDVNSGNKGGRDFWVVKINALAQIEWEKTYGGSADESSHSIRQTADGGFILAGYTHSTDGDVIGNHGGVDCWIVKLDGLGAIEWQKTLGGALDEWANSVTQTMDGGFIFAGSSYSIDGDVVGNHGKKDYWVVKFDALGDIKWQKLLGGTEKDGGQSIQQTTDGGFILAGFSDSDDGNVSGNNGGNDVWIVKLHPDGSINANFDVPSPCPGEPNTFTNTSVGTSTYEWFVDGISVSTDTNLTYTFTQAGTYTVDLIASNNELCTDTHSEIIEISDCVYPGDANKDGIVDLYDLLALSLAYGQSGPPRLDQSIGFYPHPADDWPYSHSGDLYNGINHKHADGNGDGTADEDDMLAITDNYGETTPSYNPISPPSSVVGATLSTDPNTGILQQGQSYTIDVHLRDYLGNTGAGMDIYGLVFRLKHGGIFQNIDFSQSCLGNDLLTHYVNDATEREVTVALARKDHQDVLCDGSIIKITVVIDETPAGEGPVIFVIDSSDAAISNAGGDYFSITGASSIPLSVYEPSDVPPVIIRANVLLEGAYELNEYAIFDNIQLMGTNLRSKELLPLNQPFNTAPWYYNGPEAFNLLPAMPSNAVDWVLLEVRSPDRGDAVEQKAAILLSDGSIVDVDGVTYGVKFYDIDNEESYHLIVRSRNHLAVMSATTITPQNHLAVYDFTTGANQAAGGTNQLVEVAAGIYALRSGDLNADGVISTTDYNDFQSSMPSTNAYLPSDCNLDGDVTEDDLDEYEPNRRHGWCGTG